MDNAKKPPELTIFICGTKGHEHIWDGPVVPFDDGLGATSTCSICGAWAVNVCLLEEE